MSFSTKEQCGECLNAADNLVILPLLLATENICRSQTSAWEGRTELRAVIFKDVLYKLCNAATHQNLPGKEGGTKTLGFFFPFCFLSALQWSITQLGTVGGTGLASHLRLGSVS